LTLVLDASVGVASSLRADGFEWFEDERLVAPSLFWSEAASALHELLWRREIAVPTAGEARIRLRDAPVEARDDAEIRDRAWELAEELGWAKTYDAEYVALGQLLECRVVTLDARLRRACDRLGFVVGPSEL
jgi:predicted nucleic acid-binding protein